MENLNNSENISNTYVVFEINNDFFALSTDYVTEVIEDKNITKVPLTPDHILGVINFRGNILPIISGKIKFNFKDTEDKKENYLILVIEIEIENKKNLLGMVVDNVSDVQKRKITDIIEVPASDNKFNAEYIDGAFKIDEKYIYILNAKKVFSEQEINILN